MAFESKPSRFAVLPDDVSEPIVKAAKVGDKLKKKKKPSGDNKKGTGDAPMKKKPAKGKSLKSLAFGGSNDGKKTGPQPQDVNKNLQTSGLLSNGTNKTSAQWEEWQRRDNEVVDVVYENDLGAALVQSQLEYQTQLSRKESDQASGKQKGKKKAVTVPLNEFNAMLLDTPKTNGVPNPYPDLDDEELIERFRNEARLQLEREKELAQQREILASRQSEGVYKHPHSKERAKELTQDEQVLTIESLKAENELLKSEVESYKSRLKKVHDIFQSAQELKDKAKLIFQVDTLTKTAKELNDEIQDLHSQLEQERSKSHAAVNECRRLVQQQSRRRTNTEAST